MIMSKTIIRRYSRAITVSSKIPMLMSRLTMNITSEERHISVQHIHRILHMNNQSENRIPFVAVAVVFAAAAAAAVYYVDELPSAYAIAARVLLL